MPARHVSLIAACLLLVPATLLAQGTNTRKTPGPTASGHAVEVARSDRTFLENAAQGGHAEVEGSKLAQQKSSSAAVKSFAARMVQDHTKVGEELTKLASSKGYTAPTEPSLTQKGELKTLSALDGSKFDKMYSSRIGVAAHESTLKMFKEAAESSKDGDIKAFAVEHVPELEEHLKMARALNKKVGND